jgi:hypothetical protein
MERDKITLSADLDPKVYEQIREAAFHEHCSMAEFIRRAINDRLATHRKKRGS